MSPRTPVVAMQSLTCLCRIAAGPHCDDCDSPTCRRSEDAVAVLEPHLPTTARALARNLLDLGCIDEAIDRLRQTPSTLSSPLGFTLYPVL